MRSFCTQQTIARLNSTPGRLKQSVKKTTQRAHQQLSTNLIVNFKFIPHTFLVLASATLNIYWFSLITKVILGVAIKNYFPTLMENFSATICIYDLPKENYTTY